MSGEDTDGETGNVGAENAEGERRSGLRPIGEAASRVAAPIVMRRGGGALVQLKAQWYAIAGADLALQTWPEKLARDGALRLRVLPGFALDLQHRAVSVIDRINTFFGRALVKRLVLVQGPLPLDGSMPAGSGPRPPAAPGDAAGGFDAQALASRLAGIEDPELRAALAGLAALIFGTPRQAGQSRIGSDEIT